MSASASSLAWSVLHRPEIVSAGRYSVSGKRKGHSCRSEETVALHHHDYEGFLHIGADRFELRPGDLTVTPAGAESLFDLPADGYHFCIHFRHLDSSGAEEAHALNLPLHLRPGPMSELVHRRIRWIMDLHRRAAHADPRRRVLALAAASAGLQELILTLALLEPEEELSGPSSAKVEAAMQTFVELVESRLKEPLFVPELAEEAKLSQNYLAQAFRRRYGVTMPHFILQRRIELACHLLATGGTSITEIAHEAGLPDLQYFNKQFRRLMGLSPSAYREKVQGSKSKAQGNKAS